jgi:Protein of unknown function (DUF1566)
MTLDAASRQMVSVATAVALGAFLMPAVAHAGKKTCLTGTDPSVAGDSEQIAAVRALTDSICPCTNFDGSAGKTHGNYVSCTGGVINTQTNLGLLRKQCKGTVKKYYSASTCGVSASEDRVPCVKKSAAGKVTCAIKPSTKCVDNPGRYTQAACSGFTQCIAAADTDGSGIIDPGDSGGCGASGCCDGATFGLCFAGNAAALELCQFLGLTWVPEHHCDCDAQSCGCFEGTPIPVPPTPTSVPTPTPTPDPRYVDNGNGTITDTQTGLMWEKKDDAGGIHDKDNLYSWSSTGTAKDGTAFTTFLVGLNSPPCFAGHCDWRLPTAPGAFGFPTGQAAELASIVLAPYPCAINPCVSGVFNRDCTPGCTVASCSCTASDFYWSGSALVGTPTDAWGVAFDNGLVEVYANKTVGFPVRAVR